MVAIGSDNALPFFIQPAVQRSPFPNRRALIGPGGAFHLVVKAHLIRRHKGGFWRAVGMKPNVVQAVRLANANDALPCLHLGWWMPGQGKNGAFQRAPQENPTAV